MSVIVLTCTSQLISQQKRGTGERRDGGVVGEEEEAGGVVVGEEEEVGGVGGGGPGGGLTIVSFFTALCNITLFVFLFIQIKNCSVNYYY